jgi:SAM-dependent methyltransferase
LKALVHQDPFTYRAFSKPRGYAGDAEMIDYIYGREEHWAPPHTTPIGSYVFDYTTMSPASKGVRTRRGFVADLLDRLADEIPMPHVLSVAAGHLREVELSAAVKRRRLGRYAALDADPHSLALVERCYGRFGVETVAADIRELFTARRDIGQFDLVYTMGLYDYLPQRLGRRLAASLFRRLRRRGRLVIANFLPEIHDIGYMEAYMDWFLVYRNREEMVNLTMDIPQADLRDIILWSEENQNILFLEVKKA